MTKTERAQYKEWLDGLKPGDEVGVQVMSKSGPIGSQTIEEVRWRGSDYISIKGDYGATFNAANGRANERLHSGPRMLVPVSEEAMAARKAQQARNRLHSITWWSRDSVSDETVLAVAKLLDEANAQKAQR